MNKEHEVAFIKELKHYEVKTKDNKRLIHLFSVIEDAAFENNINARQIIACYNLAEISLAKG